MFDFSFYELIVLAIIALIVLGPEKLPQAVRKAGMYYARLRRTISTLKTEMETELDLVETRQKMQDELLKIRQAEVDMQKEMAQLRGEMKELEQQTDLQPAKQKSQDAQLSSLTNNSKPGDLYATQATHKHANPLVEGYTQPTTQPWQNMWFLLGDFDRAKRLPPPPLLPDYSIQPLLNNPSKIQQHVDRVGGN